MSGDLRSSRYVGRYLARNEKENRVLCHHQSNRTRHGCGTLLSCPWHEATCRNDLRSSPSGRADKGPGPPESPAGVHWQVAGIRRHRPGGNIDNKRDRLPCMSGRSNERWPLVTGEIVHVFHGVGTVQHPDLWPTTTASGPVSGASRRRHASTATRPSMSRPTRGATGTSFLSRRRGGHGVSFSVKLSRWRRTTNPTRAALLLDWFLYFGMIALRLLFLPTYWRLLPNSLEIGFLFCSIFPC